MADSRYPTPVAAELADDVLDRFLRYVQVDTQSDDDSESYPSTAKQLDLTKMLADELREIGLEGVELTEHGYVFATVPGTSGPTVGLIAHACQPDGPCLELATSASPAAEFVRTITRGERYRRSRSAA